MRFSAIGVAKVFLGMSLQFDSFCGPSAPARRDVLTAAYRTSACHPVSWFAPLFPSVSINVLRQSSQSTPKESKI